MSQFTTHALVCRAAQPPSKTITRSIESKMTLTPEQLECLASPACSSVFRALRALGRASANEIASKVERSAATVIYHLRRLEESGLIEIVERRAAKRKPEAIYEPKGWSFELPHGPEVRDLRVRAVQAGLRHAVRDGEGRVLFEGQPLLPGRNLEINTDGAILSGVVRTVAPDAP